MRIIVLINLVFFICNSCNKTKKLGNDYASFVGVWECTAPEYSAKYTLTKSGRFTFVFGIVRSNSFRVSSVNIVEPSMLNNLGWMGMRLKDITGKKKGRFYFNESRDTITSIGYLVNNHCDLDKSDAKQFYFVRK